MQVAIFSGILLFYLVVNYQKTIYRYIFKTVKKKTKEQKNQEEHHATRSHLEELKELLKERGIE